MPTTSHKIADNLFMVRHVLPQSGPPPKPAEPPPTDHIAIVDCSGSMWGELDKVKRQLKNKLATLLGPKDTITIIWFSSRGQCGIVIEAEPVASLTDLAAVHKAIDKWLNATALTGFKEPIELAAKTAKKLAKSGRTCALFFMSDGMDNQWSRSEILKAVEEIAPLCASATFVEYGYYVDRALLAAMAEKAGGAHIFAEDFPRYEPIFDAAMQKRPLGVKRVEATIEGDPILGFVWRNTVDGDLLTYGVEFSKVAVPEDTADLYYLSPQPVGSLNSALDAVAASGHAAHPAMAGAYGALSLLAVRMKPDVIYPILRALGDVHFIERFAACFGKQQYSAFMDLAKGAVFTGAGRFTKGRDPKKVPDDNAFTLLQLLELLAEDDNARVFFDHPSWKYSRIGRERIDANDALSPEDQTKLGELAVKLGKAKSAKATKAVQDEIDVIMAKKSAALVFTPNPAPDGYAISGLTLNNERPNVSVLVKKEGTVDLSKRIAETKGLDFKKLPAPFPTWIFRNYTIIKDGLVNVEKMPVRVSRATYDKLAAAGVDITEATVNNETAFAVLNLKPLPTINRSMVKTASAKTLFALEWELTQARAAQKVVNTYAKELAPKMSRGYGVVYGADLAEWLKEQGLTDYNGFSPKVVQAPPSGDFYNAKLLSVSIKGFASLPSVKDVKPKIGGPKPLTGCAALMAPYINDVDKFLADNAKAPANVRTGWLEGEQKSRAAVVRGLLFKKAQAVFTIIVGQVWFEEFPTLDDKTLTMHLAARGLGAADVACTAELEEEKIEL